MTDFDAEIQTPPNFKEGLIDTHNSQRYLVTKHAHYKLRAHRTSDDTWQYWTDVVVSLLHAPGGAVNYDPASLTVQGIFQGV